MNFRANLNERIKTMIEEFKNNEEGYLNWVSDNPEGYIVNIDYHGTDPDYPMVHRATHKSVTTSKTGNFTTTQYYKVCANNLDDLENWSQQLFDKKLKYCQTCMKQ